MRGTIFGSALPSGDAVIKDLFPTEFHLLTKGLVNLLNPLGGNEESRASPVDFVDSAVNESGIKVR
jgi:hypothetical protein